MLNEVTKKFLLYTDTSTATCPRCGCNYGPDCKYELTERTRHCGDCGTVLILPYEKSKALTEMLLADSSDKKPLTREERNIRQVAEIERAAKTHNINLKTSRGQDQAYALAYAEKPELFQQKAEVNG